MRDESRKIKIKVDHEVNNLCDVSLKICGSATLTKPFDVIQFPHPPVGGLSDGLLMRQNRNACFDTK
jgi:hypothetical protein